MKRIILCADDYAQSAAISAGILQLIEKRRLSAVSCFTESTFWSQPENTVFDHREHIDIGLHFNLTQPFSDATVTAQPLNTVMRLALRGRYDRALIKKALHAQLDRFEAVAKQMPDFVDGHQHVHVLPGIRDVVIGELSRRYAEQSSKLGQHKPYLRAVNPNLPGHGGFIKLLVLKLLGGGFGALAQRNNLQTNRGFAGIYSLRPQESFAKLMSQWLHSADNGDLLMCHPGASTSDISDPIAATRPHELAFLQSDKFNALLSRNAICLSRFRDITD